MSERQCSSMHSLVHGTLAYGAVPCLTHVRMVHMEVGSRMKIVRGHPRMGMVATTLERHASNVIDMHALVYEKQAPGVMSRLRLN